MFLFSYLFYMSRWFGDLVRLFYPDICVGCGNALFAGEKVLCTNCLYLLPRTHYHQIVNNPVSRLFWGRIQIEAATAFFVFEKGSIFQSLIHQLKYSGRKDIGLFLGKMMGQELRGVNPYASANRIVPVPLHTVRQRERGYNQSEYIARGIASSMNIPLERDNLVRTGKTSSQTRKSRYERWENVQEMFHVKHPDKLLNTHILLVDDVVTTGATLEACASVLLNLPGVRISIATLGMA